MLAAESVAQLEHAPLAVLAELAAHRRLETTRRYSLPSEADRQAAVDRLPVDFLMPTRFLSAAEPSVCSAFPESIAPEDVAAHFTLTADDLAVVRQHRGAPSRLRVALQQCALRLLGFVPADLMDAPAKALDYLAGQLDVPARAVFDSGCAGRRAATITSPSAVTLASNALTMPRWDGWRRGWPSLRSSMTARRS